MKLVNRFVFFVLLSCVPVWADDQQDTLVDEWDRVSDFDARKALSDLLATKKATADDAMEHLEQLLVEKPDDFKTNLLLTKVLLQKKKYKRAAEVFERVVVLAPQDPQSLSELALLTLEMGHAVEAKRLFAVALDLAGDEVDSIILSYAGALQVWGITPTRNVSIATICASILQRQQCGDHWRMLCKGKDGLQKRNRSICSFYATNGRPRC